MSRQDFTSHLGIRTRVHEALYDVLFILLTSSTDRGLKLSSFTAGAAVSEQGGLTWILLMESLISSTFSTGSSPNLFVTGTGSS